jgi:CRP-like cAMP-binding protein
MYVGQDGNTVLLCLRGPGDLLGELAGGIGEQRMASVVAIERCVAYGLSDQDFHGRLRLGGLESKFRRYMVEKLRETAPRQWQTARASAEARLAELLLYAVKVAGPSHKTPMLVPLSQEEMADALGVVRSSVTSPLARWRMAGLVTVQHGGTEVLDPAGLRSIVRAAGL